MKRVKITAIILAGLMAVGVLGACDTDVPTVPNRDDEQTAPTGTNSNENSNSNGNGNGSSNGNGNDNSGNGNASSNNNGNGSSGNGNSSSNNNGNGSSSNGNGSSGDNGNSDTAQSYTVDSIENFNEGIVVYQGTMTAEDGSQTVGYGYIDNTGKVITPPVYQKAHAFYKGLAAVEKSENQKGYIDTTGKEVIPCVYSSITSTMDTLAWVTTADGVEQMINIKGEVIYTATGKEISKGHYQNGFFWVETKEEKISGNVFTMTYYNEKGEVAFSIENVRPADEELGGSNFDCDGYAIVQLKSGVNWWITSEGEIVNHTFTGFSNPSITQRQGNVYFLNDYPYYVSSDKKTSFKIDLRRPRHLEKDYYYPLGDSTIKFKGINFLYDFSQGTQDSYLYFKSIEELGGASVMSIAYQRINENDAFVLNLHSDSGVGFMAVVDFNGNVLAEPVKAWIGDPIYQSQLIPFLIGYSINPICAGYIKAQDQDTKLFGYIDLTGNWVIPAQYESATDFFGEGDSAVAVVNGDTLINRKGEVLFSINGQN